MIVTSTNIKKQTRKLQMGQFSWKSQDTHRQIFCDWDEYGDQRTFYMIDPRDGTKYKEEAYEGYGIFGGRDFYELFADINKQQSSELDRAKDDIKKFEEIFSKEYKDLTHDELKYKRRFGIDLWFKYIEPPYDLRNQADPYKVISPILVENPDYWRCYTGFGKHPEDDPDQGWHTQE